MRELRRAITRRLPTSLVRPARRAARTYDRVTGLPFVRARRGVALMFHVGRCGSTVLGNMLDQHPDIYWDDEIYQIATDLGVERRDKADWLDWTRRQFSMSGRAVYGFECKALPDQQLMTIGATLEEYVREMTAAGVTHFIILERRNYLRRILSQYIGAMSKERHLAAGATARRRTVRLDLDAITFGRDRFRPMTDALEEIDAVYRELERLLAGKRTLHLVYEEDIDRVGPHVAYDKVCAHLGLPSARPEVENSRTNPFPVSELVENFDELRARLEGTRFAWMLG